MRTGTPTRAPALRGGIDASIGALGDEDLAMLEVALARAIGDLGRAPRALRVVGHLARVARAEAEGRGMAAAS
jgi:hypothetical protein